MDENGIRRDQPQLGNFDDDVIEAWRRAVNPCSLHERITRAVGERRATERNINLFLVSAAILNISREEALQHLLARAAITLRHGDIEMDGENNA